MHRLVPDFILKNYASGSMSGSFSAAGLFVDISGFSTMTDLLMTHGQHGAEVLAGVIRSAFAPLIQAVYEQGGMIISQAGDAFTAVFPEQESKASPALRVLAAAAIIQQRAAERALFTSPYGDFNISVKVGAGLGEVRWGIIPSANDRRAAYYFQGSAIDGCSEAEHSAGKGEVILDGSLRAALDSQVGVAAIGAYFRLESVHCELPGPCQVELLDADLNLAGRFYPRELFTQPQSGEFRQVTYLFVSLPTVRTEEQLHLFMQTIFDLLDRYGGLYELLFGDKGAHLLLFWGAPVANENDIERALEFILDLQASTTIPINGGITYRIGHAGFIGSELAEEYTAYGRGVNLAARFMTNAPRGEIWVDENVARRARRKFELEYVGEQRFKGFAQPQKVYALLERKEQIEVFFEGELLGREPELDQLQLFVQPIFQGHFPGVLVVWGEPGMGKSRLVHEFLKRLEEGSSQDVQIFLAQTDEILRQPLNPFRYWLRNYFHVSEAQGEARNKRSFNRKLDLLIASAQDTRLANELDRTRSFLGALVGLYWPDSLYEQLDAKGRYENTFIAIASLLQVESMSQPVILFLEDIHWIDADSQAFLPRLVRTLTSEEERSYPLAILVTARFEAAGQHLDGFPYQEINLDRLDRSALSALVSTRLGGSASHNLLNLLEERSGGNPFFAVQILSYILENDLLQKTTSGWIVTSSQQSTLPTDVGAILVARLDRLDKPVQEVVQTASVLGREFDLSLLGQMLPDDPNLTDKVSRAEQAAIWAGLGGIRYLFHHVLMRDAAYMMQTRARLSNLHGLALHAIEAAHAGDLPEHYGELAYHAEQSGDRETSLRYLRLAGLNARDNYQNALALDYLDRILVLLPEDEVDGRFEMLLARESIHDLLGQVQERKQDLDQLEELLDRHESPATQLELYLRQARLALDLGQYPEANALARRAAVIALEAGDDERAVTAYRNLANSLMRQGKLVVAAHQARQGLILARRKGLQLDEGMLLNILGVVVNEQGNVSEAYNSFLEALKIAEERNDLRLKVMPLNNLGMMLVIQGNFEASRRYYEQSLEVARNIGERTGEGLVLGNLGFLASSIGEYQNARDYAAGQLRIAREVDDRYSEMYGWINLSSYFRCLNDLKAALSAVQKGLEIAQELGDLSAQAWAHTNLGHASMATGDWKEAELAYREALAIRRELEQSALACEPLAGLARVALETGDSASGQQHVQAILEHLDGGGTLAGTDDPIMVYLTCYRVLDRMGETRARAILKDAYHLLQQSAASISDPTAREIFLMEIPHHREIVEAWKKHPV